MEVELCKYNKATFYLLSVNVGPLLFAGNLCLYSLVETGAVG